MRSSLGCRLVSLLTHRSRAGSRREVALWGVPACARCTSLVLGGAVGAAVATVWLPPVGVVVAGLPAVVEAGAEKLLGWGHRPRLLVGLNALAGWALGGALVTIATAHGLAVTLVLLAAVRLLLRARRTFAPVAGAVAP